MDIDLRQRLAMPRTEREITHLALDSTGIAVVAARYDAFLKDLVQNRFMKSPLLRRGE
jgi:hypothetical protein